MRKEINTIMHEAASADTTNFVYTSVYASADVAGLVINGSTVNLAKGSEVDLLVSSVGGTTTGVYLLGYKKIVTYVPGVVRG